MSSLRSTLSVLTRRCRAFAQTYRRPCKKRRCTVPCYCCRTSTARRCSPCWTSWPARRPGATWTRCRPATWPCASPRLCSTLDTTTRLRRLRTPPTVPPGRRRRAQLPRRRLRSAGTTITTSRPPPSACPTPSSWDRTRRPTTVCCSWSSNTLSCRQYVARLYEQNQSDRFYRNPPSHTVLNTSLVWFFTRAHTFTVFFFKFGQVGKFRWEFNAKENGSLFF